MATIRPNAPITAREAAGYLLALDGPEDDVVSNLKLQKLLYYAQGIYLAKYGQPMFEDVIEAWKHGPVCRSLYHELKEFGAGPVRVDVPASELPSDCRLVLQAVHKRYGQYSAWRLREMTHQDPLWKLTFREDALYQVISLDDMKHHFEEALDTEVDFVDYPNFLGWLETGEGDPWASSSN